MDPIYKIFSPFFENWMSEEDRRNFIEESLVVMGETDRSIRDKINVGITNGFSLDMQINIIRELINNIP